VESVVISDAGSIGGGGGGKKPPGGPSKPNRAHEPENVVAPRLSGSKRRRARRVRAVVKQKRVEREPTAGGMDAEEAEDERSKEEEDPVVAPRGRKARTGDKDCKYKWRIVCE